eukprot:TRINITY_DN2561_c0_g1_i1.p1 TRINITY_DN2561_c0_g1~~TRINITY_DN2561_c0_g1_i1.p1  ORF type:complete len:367 (-),score=51.82 TRINITY_DN2561_c0_g1_i1:72-1172(-)
MNVCSNCSKAASFQCPTCNKLHLPPSYFCSQQCFESSWNKHKLVHTLTEPKKEETKNNPQTDFSNFMFTGSLRPGIVSPKRTIPPNILKPDYADDPEGIPHSELAARTSPIIVYNEAEISKIRKACKIGAEVLDIAGRMAKPGVKTDEIDRVVHEAIIERGAYPSPLNYRGFPKSCCTSVNEVICHGIPDSRELKDGDICNVDISVFFEGFHGDLNETWLIGNVDEKSQKLVQTTYECLELAIKEVKPNALYRNIGNIIAKHAENNRLSVVRTYCGHGTGRLFHTSPSVPHYRNNKAVGVMKPGHVFTIEPMINEGNWKDVLWPDGWTSTTKDGKRSAQFEHTLLVTPTGCEVLTKRLRGTYLDRF